ncbi:MAG: RNA-binding protein [Clostridia bacterium]|jgi:ribosomal protein L14E/L6E/L27E|nr:RNA-binding protein [Clostridia bacterium]MBQ7582290.1 RNA-binding protein [Lachnospiraceae bacterium]MBR3195870.1 RNA-binding protein [Clostridia bacterium]
MVLSACLGSIVVPKKGRDAGRPMMIVGCIDDDYVMIADGDLRRIAKPKKKKKKHLAFQNVTHEGAAEKLRNGQPLLDSEIRYAIRDIFGC